MDAKGQIKEATLSVKVIRANGTVEDLGIVSNYVKEDQSKIFKWIKSFKNKYIKP